MSNELTKLRKDLDALHTIMSHCYSDSAYRIYAEKERTIIERIHMLEQEASKK